MGNAAAVAKAFHKLHQGVAIPNYEKLLDHGYSRLVEPGHTVFDVGAHSGLHLDRFVALVGAQGRVFAFEPIPRFARYLAARYRECSGVTVKPLALSDQVGSATFKVVEGALQQSGLRERNQGGVRRSDGRIGALAVRLANGLLERTGLNRHKIGRAHV